MISVTDRVRHGESVTVGRMANVTDVTAYRGMGQQTGGGYPATAVTSVTSVTTRGCTRRRPFALQTPHTRN